MEQLFTAHIEKDTDSGYYIGIIPTVPGAHTQAKTLDELSVRLKEVLELCFETMTDEEKRSIPQYIGTQQITIAI
jgi:predicted RNase H-like HicB family nuclease